MAIRVGVFDLGGVLFSDGTQVLSQQLPINHRYVIDQILRSQKSSELKRGKICEAEFWTWAAAFLPIELSARTLKNAWYNSYLLNEDVSQLIRKLQGRIRLGIFSGNSANRVIFLEDKYHFLSLFDFAVWSFETGYNKGDPEFVDAMIQACGCLPEEIAYIDNKESALLPAEKRGIHCFLFTIHKQDQLLKWLVSLGVLPKS